MRPWSVCKSVLIIMVTIMGAFASVDGARRWRQSNGDGGGGGGERQQSRRGLSSECMEWNPWLRLDVDAMVPLADVQNVTVTVRGVLAPHPQDWMALVAPTNDDISFTEDCPFAKFLYLETGDTQELPLLCHYPIKFKYIKVDDQYLSCKRTECNVEEGGVCLVKTCSGSLTFRLINIRSNVEFVFMGHGLLQPCLLLASVPLSFANPRSPLYGHLSSVNSAADSMRVTWISGDDEPQYVLYGNNNTSIKSFVTTFRQNNMCDTPFGPAASFGWHDPGFIHSVVLTRLEPSSWHDYQYGSDKVGWSKRTSFHTPPAVGAKEVNVILYADMGKNERDGSEEHFLQEGALDAIDSVTKAVNVGDIDIVFHIGDISYATGFLVEWDIFMEMIGPVASRLPYMTASGNHERDFPGSGSFYNTPDSGGECGVPYETYFQMPSQGIDKPWYSIDYGPVHFTIMSTEMNWTFGSEQYIWLNNDLASVNRSHTPWVIFSGHRPLYSSVNSESFSNAILHSVDPRMTNAIEPLLVQYEVDIAVWGHVHQYERTCAIQKDQCVFKPSKNDNGIDSYNTSSYCGPIHLIIGNAGFRLDQFDKLPADWSLVRISEFGYSHLYATHECLQIEVVLAKSGAIGDKFELLRSPSPNTKK